jgi:hydrogenase maturation protease
MRELDWHLLEDKPSLRSATVNGIEVKPGDRVRLCPREGGDIFDIALAGQIAAVEAIEQDYEGQIHFSVVVEDDPGRDIGMMRQPAHRFFFKASEVEPLPPDALPDRAVEKTPTILIAGIGNIFLGDDGFGVEVASRFAARELPEGVRVVDFGIRGLDLAYALLAGPDVTILLDACPRGGKPGDLYVVEPQIGAEAAVDSPCLDAHSMNPVSVIQAAQSMGGPLRRILLLGCEPETLGPEEGQMGLSAPVSAAVDAAIPMLESLVARILKGESPAEPRAGSPPGAA